MGFTFDKTQLSRGEERQIVELFDAPKAPTRKAAALPYESQAHAIGEGLARGLERALAKIDPVGDEGREQIADFAAEIDKANRDLNWEMRKFNTRMRVRSERAAKSHARHMAKIDKQWDDLLTKLRGNTARAKSDAALAGMSRILNDPDRQAVLHEESQAKRAAYLAECDRRWAEDAAKRAEIEKEAQHRKAVDVVLDRVLAQQAHLAARMTASTSDTAKRAESADLGLSRVEALLAKDGGAAAWQADAPKHAADSGARTMADLIREVKHAPD